MPLLFQDLHFLHMLSNMFFRVYNCYYYFFFLYIHFLTVINCTENYFYQNDHCVSSTSKTFPIYSSKYHKTFFTCMKVVLKFHIFSPPPNLMKILCIYEKYFVLIIFLNLFRLLICCFTFCLSFNNFFFFLHKLWVLINLFNFELCYI